MDRMHTPGAPGSAQAASEAASSDFAALSIRVDKLARDLQTNTEATKRVEENTAELVDAFKAVRGGMRVLGWLGTAAKWLTSIAAAGAVVWAAWHQTKT